jgi:uncharacterized membrane protein
MDTSLAWSRTSRVQATARWVLGLFLTSAGIGHFVVTASFLAQVPPFLPAPTAIVYVSGVVEVVLGLALLAVPRWRVPLGWVAAAFFLAVLPGNISQAVTGASSFGLDTPAARWGRLLFQPALIAWALWSTGAWATARRGRR